jgi:hypothetical protein
MSLLHLSGLEALRAEVTFPLWGAWTARVELDGDAAPSGAVTLQIAQEGASPASWSGFVRDASAWQGRVRVLVVGGAGNLRTDLDAKHYAPSPYAVSVAQVLQDIAGDAKETLSSTATIDGELARWSRARAPAGACLTSLAEKVGATWRVLSDGTIWMGTETWPSFTSPLYELEEDGEARVLQFAPDTVALMPGVVVLGRRAVRVTYKVESGIRAEVLYG